MPHDHATPKVELSPAGAVRRTEILAVLTTELGARRRRRRLAGALTMVANGGVALGLAVVARGPAPRAPHGTLAQRPAETAPVRAPAIAVQRIGSRAGLATALAAAPAGRVERWSGGGGVVTIARSEPRRVARLSDGELAEVLARLGLPTGVVRVGGSVWLTRSFERPRPHGAADPSRDDGLS